jgi:hypothetical protein
MNTTASSIVNDIRAIFEDGAIELYHVVHEGIARLPERYRAPIVLCELEGLSCDEAAHCLGCPVGTIKSRRSRGRNRLRSHLSRRGLTPGELLGLPMLVPAALVESTARIAKPSLRGATAQAVAGAIVRAMIVSQIKVIIAGLLCAGSALVIAIAWFSGNASIFLPARRIERAIPHSRGVVAVGAEDDENDGLPGQLTGPSRHEIEALIKRIGRDKVTPELVDQIMSFFRPRAKQERDRWNALCQRVNEAPFVARMDALTRELTGQPADTRNLVTRALGDHNGRQDDLHRVEMRDDLARHAKAAKTLRGRVQDVEGNPVAGVTVSTSGALSRSDAKGEFTLRFHRPRVSYATVYLEAKGYGLTEGVFLLDEAKESVIGPDGKPAANAAVGWLEPLDAGGRRTDQDAPENLTHTKADGSFRLGPAPEGVYKILGLIDPPRSEAYAVCKTGQTDIVIRHEREAK